MTALPQERPVATLYRMVLDQHVCPYGLEAKDLLKRQGYEVEDRWLTTRAETDNFKAPSRGENDPAGVH